MVLNFSKKQGDQYSSNFEVNNRLQEKTNLEICALLLSKRFRSYIGKIEKRCSYT
jgi:hypothetical protein